MPPLVSEPHLSKGDSVDFALKKLPLGLEAPVEPPHDLPRSDFGFLEPS